MFNLKETHTYTPIICNYYLVLQIRKKLLQEIIKITGHVNNADNKSFEYKQNLKKKQTTLTKLHEFINNLQNYLRFIN